MFRETSEYVGFTNLYDFRHLYKPWGYLSNVWGSLLIGFIGIVTLTAIFYRHNKGKQIVLFIVFILVLFGIVVSFSRGVYISCAFLLLSLLAYLIFSRIPAVRKGIICVVVFVPLLLFGILQRNEVLRTVRFNETLSQQRSISGRMEAMQATGELFRESPLFGSGTGTYSMVINDYKYENDNNSFTNFAPNGYIQLLIEQGIVGLIIWSLPVFILIFMLLKHRKRDIIPKVIAVILISVLIREASFPVFSDSSGFQLLVFSLLAIFQNVSTSKLLQPDIAPSLTRYLFVIILVFVILSGIYAVFQQAEEKNNREILSALQSDNIEKAEKFMNKTSDRIPNLINKSRVYLELYKRKKEILFLNKAKSNLDKAILKNKHDIMLQYYRMQILEEEGKQDSAQYVIKNLSERFPNKSLYQFATFNSLYKQHQIGVAIPYLIKTVKLSPTILDSPYWMELKKNDSTFIQSISDSLFIEIRSYTENNINADPVLLARYGKILLSMEYEHEAKQLLEKAIALLPNLIYPRYYLSKIEINQENNDYGLLYLKQYVFLSSGIPYKDYINRVVNSNEIDQGIANRNFIFNDYKTKFETWYCSFAILQYE
jgi:tetratricopeptide (TPR) repeat protein